MVQLWPQMGCEHAVVPRAPASQGVTLVYPGFGGQEEGTERAPASMPHYMTTERYLKKQEARLRVEGRTWRASPSHRLATTSFPRSDFQDSLTLHAAISCPLSHTQDIPPSILMAEGGKKANIQSSWGDTAMQIGGPKYAGDVAIRGGGTRSNR